MRAGRAREGTSHCARVLWRRLARRLYARHQQGNSQARPRVERAARRSPTAPRAPARRSSTASTAPIPNTTPSRSISSCCATSAAASSCGSIVDIIAGASAGGINGTMLARALAHDLPMEALRDLWLDNADVTVLLSPDARAGGWSKWFLQAVPLGRGQAGMLGADPGPGGAPQAVAVRALALVQAAARRPHHGRADVRRRDARWSRRSRAGVAAAVRTDARSVRDADRLSTATSSSCRSTIRR